VSGCKFQRVAIPHGKRTVKASVALLNDCLVAMFLKVLEVHGNSLDLTSKSPLTRIGITSSVATGNRRCMVNYQCGRGRESRANQF
jgi:hypothetical protein